MESSPKLGGDSTSTLTPAAVPNVTTPLTGVNPRSKMSRYKDRCENLAALNQRLWRLLQAAILLEQSTIKILERASLHRAPPEVTDVADLTDRLHEVFNAYTFLTRVPT